MSRAFVREDVDPPERKGRSRSASGLPPGATNYITARGAARLRAELAAAQNPTRIAELKEILQAVEVVERAEVTAKTIPFGATVTVEDQNGATSTFTIVGVDEIAFEPDAVSWISPMGRKLLAAEVGGRVMLEDGRSARILNLSFRKG